MAGDDMRYYETYYAVHLNDWMETYGSFINHHKLLTKEYESEGCSTLNGSACSQTYEFLYPEHIKKTYFIEGVIKGQITIVASSATVIIDNYRVTVCKVNDAGTKTELFTTGWITTGTTLNWDAAYPDSGDEIVYPFRIDAWDKAKLYDHEKLFLRVQIDNKPNADLWHSNDSTWEDIKITIPFRM